TPPNGDVEFNSINFSYSSGKGVPILRNLSLIARAGQTTALVGSSGCGKSTCMSLFLRYYEPISGRITIDGRPITDYSIKQLRHNIGIVSQEPILFGLTIYENIRFGKLNATRAEIEQAAREANAHNFIMELANKYETLVGERGVQLSGGEKQRIALARALVKQPSFLLLDEATSALDNINEKIVQEALDRACKSRTTIVIAHRLSTIRNADQIYVLVKGVVIEQDGKVFDDADDTMIIEQATAEDEKSRVEHSRLLSSTQILDVTQQSPKSFSEKSAVLRLLSMNSPEWVTIVIGCVACILNGAAQPVFAILLALIYTAFAISGSKLTHRIRSKAFACLLRQEVAYFDRPENSSGAICTRLSTDALAVQEMTGPRLGVICEAISFMFFGVLLGCSINWQLTLIAFSPITILFLITYGDANLRIWSSQQSSQLVTRVSTLAVEFIHNSRTVKQLSMEKEILRQYAELIYQAFILPWKPLILHAIAFGIFWILEVYGVAFLFWRVLFLLEKNELGLSQILMSNRIASTSSAVKTFLDLFDRTPTIDNASTEGQELADFRGGIKFDQVTFIYPTRPTSIVLSKLTLDIKPSQRVALVGTSGCGKSTIIQMLERFYDVTSGQLLLDGVDIRQLNLHWLRSHFGLVSQEPILFDLTIAENIAYGLENVPMEDIINAATKANIHQLIEGLPQGYETRVGLKGSFLSGGEKQRIAIARVFIRRPKVLLLDEATSAMDSQNEQIVQAALEQAQIEDPSRTSLIIAHRLSTIRSCDLICVLDRGRIVESGNHSELMQRRGIYYKMVNENDLY
ncbi:unnamed protein product, partial [Rotaria magnacalcarata]